MNELNLGKVEIKSQIGGDARAVCNAGGELSDVQDLNLRFQDTSDALSTNTLPKAQCSREFSTFAKATARQARKKQTLGFNIFQTLLTC